MKILIRKKDEVVIHDRDISIVKGLSNGLRVKDIAPIVDISPRTVEARIAALMTMFNCKSSSHLVAFFIRNQLIK